MGEREIEAFLKDRSEAIRTKDIDLLMVHYSADVIYYDVVPPLRYVGSEALRKRFLEWFGSYATEVGQEIRDLKVWADGDIAIAAMLIQSSGTLRSGQKIGAWARATSCFQRSNNRWLITHEHISLPVDPRSGTIAFGLEPA